MIEDHSLIPGILKLFSTGLSLPDLIKCIENSHYLSLDAKEKLISDIRQIYILHWYQKEKDKKNIN